MGFTSKKFSDIWNKSVGSFCKVDQLLVFWVLFALLMFLVELTSPGLLFFVAFACGALVAALAQYWGIGLLVQLTLFLIFSVLVIIILRKLVGGSISQKGQVSNVDALIGKRGVVTTKLSPHLRGFVKINGEEWSAREEKHSPVPVGTIVEVIKVIGCHVVVKIVKGKES